MFTRLLFCVIALGVLGTAACNKRTEAPPGMTVTTDQTGTRRLEGPPLPADAPPQAREMASTATAEARHAAQQNAAMANGMKAARGR